MHGDNLVVTRRFRGPAMSGNGGYTAGLLSRRVTLEPTPVTVVLRRPPPLNRELDLRQVARDTGTAEPGTVQVELLDGSNLVAAAGPGGRMGHAVDPVDLDRARAAESSYKGLKDHPFPGCFVCGTERVPGDGLRLRPGQIGPGLTACVWRPDPSLADPADTDAVAAEFVWASLDCPGGWTSDLDARPLVLGTMTAVCRRPPRIGHDYVVVGALVAEEGRKTRTTTALYDETGNLRAQAEQVWVAVDPAAFGRR